MYIEDDTDIEIVLGREGQPQPVVPQLEQIFKGVVDDDETLIPIINRYQASSPFSDKGFRAGQWFETTEQTYWHFLETMPPLYMSAGGFVMCECITQDLYDCFLEINGRYYCVVIKWVNAKSFSLLLAALRAEVSS